MGRAGRGRAGVAGDGEWVAPAAFTVKELEVAAVRGLEAAPMV